jgi:hypothetical protein
MDLALGDNVEQCEYGRFRKAHGCDKEKVRCEKALRMFSL